MEDATKIKNTDIAKELSLPPVKLHCSSESVGQSHTHARTHTHTNKHTVLAEDAIKAALKDYKLKQEKLEGTG